MATAGPPPRPAPTRERIWSPRDLWTPIARMLRPPVSAVEFPVPMTTGSSVSLTTMMPRAPARWACCALATKVQFPRRTTATKGSSEASLYSEHPIGSLSCGGARARLAPSGSGAEKSASSPTKSPRSSFGCSMWTTATFTLASEGFLRSFVRAAFAWPGAIGVVVTAASAPSFASALRNARPAHPSTQRVRKRPRKCCAGIGRLHAPRTRLAVSPSGRNYIKPMA
mmetsp:Transcript_21977/g.61592  ORF Transcript_21977/g.61592 Transcript_21977/m.61592 type:complete len:226 (+) Transcript_21977:1137-1814(+)